jgi:hypothetical protein
LPDCRRWTSAPYAARVLVEGARPPHALHPSDARQHLRAATGSWSFSSSGHLNWLQSTRTRCRAVRSLFGIGTREALSDDAGILLGSAMLPMSWVALISEPRANTVTSRRS